MTAVAMMGGSGGGLAAIAWLLAADFSRDRNGRLDAARSKSYAAELRENDS